MSVTATGVCFYCSNPINRDALKRTNFPVKLPVCHDPVCEDILIMMEEEEKKEINGNSTLQ